VALPAVKAFDCIEAHLKGKKIRIHAGARGAGSFAIQYAEPPGMHVDASVSEAKSQLAKGLGAEMAVGQHLA
jgi:NADPH:quinone reductase-like Zn-dependent oxidoreductase